MQPRESPRQSSPRGTGRHRRVEEEDEKVRVSVGRTARAAQGLVGRRISLIVYSK